MSSRTSFASRPSIIIDIASRVKSSSSCDTLDSSVKSPFLRASELNSTICLIVLFIFTFGFTKTIFSSLKAAFTACACVAVIAHIAAVGITMITELKCTKCTGFPPSSISPTERLVIANIIPKILVKSIPILS